MFREYVETDWLPSKHIEPTTKAAYVSNLNKHFYPFFGRKQLHQITPALVQDWVTKAAADGLSPRSIRKYHTMLHSIFERAVRDRLIVANPCAHTELPKVIATKSRTLTPDEFDLLIAAIPDRYRLMVETAIETGMRWGELIALKPRHIDFLRRTGDRRGDHHGGLQEALPHRRALRRQALPQGQRTPHLRRRRQDWLDAVAEHIKTHGIGRDDLLFATTAGTPISRNTFRTRVWQPAVKASGVDFNVRMHDLRHAHASWLLAGGSDLASSWTAWATPRSRPPRSTSTPPPTPTRRTSTPSTGSATRTSPAGARRRGARAPGGPGADVPDPSRATTAAAAATPGQRRCDLTGGTTMLRLPYSLPYVRELGGDRP